MDNLDVARLDPLLDPSGEWLTDACEDDVGQELLRQLLPLFLDREVGKTFGMLLDKDLHLFDGELLVLRDC